VQSISVDEKKDELLLNVDDEEPIEHRNNNTSNRILEDLNDLRFEENNKNKDELLLNVGGQEPIEHGNNNASNRILEDLNNLRFEENDKNKDELEGKIISCKIYFNSH